MKSKFTWPGAVVAVFTGLFALLHDWRDGPSSTPEPMAQAQGSQPITATGQNSRAQGNISGNSLGSGSSLVAGDINNFGTSQTFNGPTHVTAASDVKPSNPADIAARRQLPGTYLTDYVQPGSAGSMRVQGRTRFLPNGSFEFNGTTEVEASVANEPGTRKQLRAAYNVASSGKWEIIDSHLLVQHVGMRSTLQNLEIDGSPYDLGQAQKLGFRMPRLEDEIPAGKPDDYALIALDAKQMTLQSQTPSGKVFSVRSVRVP
ncbi:hypothetical protein [Rhizobacter sp. Root1221]|uniref:hypothetical protein n=1 Tax=Rhizobacter sp. Root1221 TaxID=1736433 RepID=UPI000AE3AE64|nr:hypothetical protein [Rhizobacter sp. Root1221]